MSPQCADWFHFLICKINVPSAEVQKEIYIVYTVLNVLSIDHNPQKIIFLCIYTILLTDDLMNLASVLPIDHNPHKIFFFYMIC